MRTIDLRDYVVARWGEWTSDDRAFTPTLFRLDNTDDGVTLSGPLRVQVSVQGRNLFLFPGTNRLAYQSKELFCYVLDVPPGQTWSYPGPRRFIRPQALASLAANTANAAFEERGAATSPADAAASGASLQTNLPSASAQSALTTAASFIGTNAGISVVIRPAGPVSCQDPCATDPCESQCGSRCGCGSSTCGCNSGGGQCGGQCGCGGGRSQCGCGGVETLPCDFAVASRPNAGRFFPVGCESCTPGAAVALPPLQGPALLVSPARGGTVRTRYFTGMFIGREDLETDQRNVRLKRALMNRAMGQGVVWGLGVGLDGDGVCVMPGYGVDCCGNDLILSQTYRVDGAALVRDPAAQAILAMQGPQRLHLVLEYYECPEAPRPVHGDPCANDARCEPSRTRETVRLRLAPPCDVDDSGPIKDFLDEVTKLKQNPTIAAAASQTSVMTTAATPVPQPRVPFSVVIQDPNNSATQLTLQPQVAAEDRGDVNLGRLAFPSTVRVSLAAESTVAFRGAPVTQTLTFDPNTKATSVISKAITTTSSPSLVEWDVQIPSFWFDQSAVNTNPIPPAMSFEIGPWIVQDQNGATFQGSTQLNLTPMLLRTWRTTPWGKASSQFSANTPLDSTILDAAVLATNVSVTAQQPPAAFPCLSEPCGDGTRKLFPTTLPFLHPDPTNPGQPADGKVIMLALLYAYVTGTLAKYRAGTPYQVQSARLDVANMLGRVSSQLFFAAATTVQQNQLVAALQHLFEAWCRGLLYPGPTCRCDPHGAVIGCATVDGGVIQSVDPWGGRRWVVHYPLLAYWGQQFGIMPPDAIASKLFDLICCIAGIGAARPMAATAATTSSFGTRQPSLTAQAIPLGRMMVFTGSDQDVTSSLAQANVQPARSLHLNPVDFIARVTRATEPTDPAGGQPLVRLSVLGVPGIAIVMPDDEAPTKSSATPAAPAVAASQATPLTDVIRTAVAGRTKTTVPLLLRNLAETVATRVADVVPLEAATPAERPVVERLNEAGITSVAKVLDSDPEVLHDSVLQKESAPELAAVLDRAEKSTQAVAREVGDTLAAYAQEHGLAARNAFTDPRIAADFAKRLGERLKKAKLASPSDEVLAALVASASTA